MLLMVNGLEHAHCTQGRPMTALVVPLQLEEGMDAEQAILAQLQRPEQLRAAVLKGYELLLAPSAATTTPKGSSAQQQQQQQQLPPEMATMSELLGSSMLGEDAVLSVPELIRSRGGAAAFCLRAC